MSAVKRSLPVAAVLALFAATVVWSQAAVDGARRGLELCAQTIVPTLLPFFVLSNLLCLLGLPAWIGGRCERLFRALFGVSGEGAAAFLFGIVGGYPLGAASAAQLCSSGAIKHDEGERLLRFCNNTGPAFIVGMAGVGVFSSSGAGLLLYGVHMAAAALAGALLCRGSAPVSRRAPQFKAESLPNALTDSMFRAVKSSALVSGFVIFFSMLTALMRESGIFTAAAGLFYEVLPLSIGRCEGLLMGFIELGSGIASLGKMQPCAQDLALAAFILGWGGLSVQLQAAAVVSGSGLSYGLRCAGAKLLHGLLSAALAFAAGGIIYGM